MCWRTRKRTSARSERRRVSTTAIGAPHAPAAAADGAAARPAHVAIIMDGNGRWAASRRLPKIAGHREGARAVRRTIEAAINERRRLADHLRLQQRELAPAGGRGARPDRPAAPLPEERDRRTEGQRRAAARHRRPHALRSRHPARPCRGRARHRGQHAAQPDGGAVLWRAGRDRRRRAGHGRGGAGGQARSGDDRRGRVRRLIWPPPACPIPT